MDFIIFMLKAIIMLVFVVPAFVLTVLIFTFGGWTKGWDYMPNPLNALLDWSLA